MSQERSLSGRASGVLELVGAVALFAMMAVTCIDIAGRVVFNRPLAGSTDIVQVLLLITAACTLPAVTWRGEHLSIGLFDGVRPSAPERARRALVGLVMALAFGALALLLFGYAGETAANADVIGYLRLPITPFVYVACAMCAVSALIALAKAIRALPAPKGNPPPAPAAHSPSVGAPS